MRKIEKIIIHCTATKENKDFDVEDIRKWHTSPPRNWSDIGYHYLIKLDGTIQEGRPVSRVGAHTRGHNKTSIGVCYVGGVDDELNPKDTRTKAQREALNRLLLDLSQIYPEATVHGHNEFSSKACPSFDVQTEL